MRWFKHMTDMHSDTFVVELIDQFGLEGYGAYIMILEIYARECGDNPGEIVTISNKVLRKKLAISHQKMIKILSFFDRNSKVFCQIGLEKCSLSIPKMKDICDEWTRKLRSKSGATPSKEEEGEEDKEEEDINILEKIEKPRENYRPYAEQGHEYLLGFKNPNYVNTEWIISYLWIQIPLILKENPGLGVEDVLSCWRDAVDVALNRKIAAPAYFKTTFLNKVKGFQKQASLQPQKDKPPRWKTLLEATVVTDITTDTQYPTSDLEPVHVNENIVNDFRVRSTGETLHVKFLRPCEPV